MRRYGTLLKLFILTKIIDLGKKVRLVWECQNVLKIIGHEVISLYVHI